MRYIRAMLSVLLLAGWLSVTLLGTILASSPARAVPGAKHTVESEFALVREEPYGAARVVARIPKRQSVIEIARQQNWLQVGVVGKGITGWIHVSFLTALEEAQRPPQPLIPPMRKFRPAFDTFNTLQRAKHGTGPFTILGHPHQGILLISASAAWWSAPNARRGNDLVSLYQMWKIANDELPVVVVIRDPSGRRQMKRADEGAIQP